MLFWLFPLFFIDFAVVVLAFEQFFRTCFFSKKNKAQIISYHKAGYVMHYALTLCANYNVTWRIYIYNEDIRKTHFLVELLN